jgi:hypothetical protein
MVPKPDSQNRTAKPGLSEQNRTEKKASVLYLEQPARKE